MTKEVTFNSIVRVKSNGKKAIVTGFTTNKANEIVGITAKYPQGKPMMYLPEEVIVIRY